MLKNDYLTPTNSFYYEFNFNNILKIHKINEWKYILYQESNIFKIKAKFILTKKEYNDYLKINQNELLNKLGKLEIESKKESIIVEGCITDIKIHTPLEVLIEAELIFQGELNQQKKISAEKKEYIPTYIPWEKYYADFINYKQQKNDIKLKPMPIIPYNEFKDKVEEKLEKLLEEKCKKENVKPLKRKLTFD